MQTKCFFVGMLVCLATTGAYADRIILSANAGELTRIRETGGGPVVETYPLPFNLVSLHKDADNNVFALGNVAPMDPRIFSLGNAASGTPTFNEIAALPRGLFGTARVNDDIFGVARDDDDIISLFKIDANTLPNPVEVRVGATGLVQDDRPGAGGMAYNADADLLTAVSADTDEFFTLDRTTGVATITASIPFDAAKVGMDWYEGETLLGSQNLTSGRIEVGTVNPLTGAYSLLYDLGPNPVVAPGLGSALVVIPEPGTAVLLLAGLFAFRRR